VEAGRNRGYLVTRVVLLVPAAYLLLRFVGLPSAPNLGLPFFLSCPDPGWVMPLGNAHTLITQENGRALNRYTHKQEFHRNVSREQDEEPLQTALPIHRALRFQ
jgi:hypothetical protein